MKPQTMPLLNPKNISKECKITFIIGNGFDLGLGMKTKFTDVYDGYVNSPNSSETIARFKAELKRNSDNNYEKWSDFEMGMASYAQTLETENELVECIRDFKSYMVEHLQNENQKMIDLLKSITNALGIIQELNRSFENFYDGLTQNDISSLKYIMQKGKAVRNYITFNYTTILEALLALKFNHYHVIENQPIHIHGKLGSDIVMGIDNDEQLIQTKFSLTRKGRRAFVKTRFNDEFDGDRVEAAQKMISESSIICVYGFSMGESDETWVKAISNWLLSDDNHHLVVYQYDTPKCNPCNYDEIMEIEDDRKELLLNRLGINNDAILDQIHIPIGRDIFNFSFKEILPHTLKESSNFDPMKTYESKSFVMN